MPENNAIRYIQELELLPGQTFRTKRSVRSSEDEKFQVQEKVEQSFFSEKSLVSFAASVKAEMREDILSSTLLAQMAANRAYPDGVDPINWYKTFLDVLGKTGWIMEGSEIQTYKASENLFEVENVVIGLLTSAFGANYITIIKKTLDAVKGMESTDKKIKAFQKNIFSSSKACFQIASAVESDNAVSMQIGTFLITTTNEMKNFIFFKTSKDKTDLQYVSRRGTLNEKAYAIIREGILAKLGDQLVTNVAEIKI